MSKRHTAETMDMRGNEYTFDLYDSDHSGDVHTLTLRGDGFTIEWDGDTDRTHPQIIGSRCTIHILNLDSETDSLLTDMATASDGRFRMEVHRKPVGGVSRLYWSGIVLTDVERTDAAFETADIEATDDLANLDAVQYRNESADYSDQVTLPVLLARIFGGIRHLDAWGSTATFFAVSDHLEHDDHTDSPYLERIIVNSSKLLNPDGDGAPQYWTLRELLDWITVMLGAVVYMAEGIFVVEAATLRADASKSFEGYTKDGSASDGATISTHGIQTASSGNTLNFATTANEQNRQRLTGWTLRQLPPLREVTALHQYNGFAPDWSGLVPSTNFAGSYWFANNAEDLESGAIVTLVFSYYLNFGGDGSGVAGARRLRGSIGYRHGTQYGKRLTAAAVDSAGDVIQQNYNTAGGTLACFAYENQAPEYSTGTSNRLQWFTDVYDKNTGGILTGQVAITFPGVPGTPGTTMVGFLNWEIFNADGTSAGPLSSSAGNGLTNIYQMHGSALLDGDDLRFSRVNGDGDAREVQDLGTAILADKMNTINNSSALATWAINPGGPYVAAEPEWNTSTFPSVSTAALDLACLEVLALRSTSTDVVRGRLEADGVTLLQGIRSADHPGPGKLILCRLVQYGASAQFEAEGYVHRLETNTGGAGTDTDGEAVNNFRALPGTNVGNTLPRRLRPNVNGQLVTVLQRMEEIERQRIAEMIKGANTKVTADDVDARVTTLEAATQVSTLDDLTDVDAPAEGTSDGDVLQYNSSAGEWEARALDPIPTATSDLTNDSGFVTSNLASADQTISAGTTRTIVLSGGAGQQVYLNVEDAQGNTLESIVAYGSGVVIQEKYGALAIRSTALFQGSVALYEAAGNGINSISIKAPAAVSSNKTFTLPDSYGSNGQHLTTDGTGTLSWASSSGGGSAVIILANISGRFMFSSTDSGERMWTGQGSYGPFNWYSFTSEPGTTMRTYSASDTVGSKTGTMNHWQLMAYGIHVPTTSKKVRVSFMMRIQNAPAGSDWGFSVWGANRTTSGTTTTSITTTLRGISSDVTATDSNSTRLYHGSFDTDAAFTEDVAILMPENRSGTLTTTTYLLCNFQLELVD